MPNKLITFIGVGVAVIGSAAALWIMDRRRWQPVGKLSSIYIYPLKSGKYKELDKAECTTLGLKFNCEGKLSLRDRTFVIFKTDTRELITGRQYPQLLKITVEPKERRVILFSYPGKENQEVHVPQKFDNIYIQFWKNEKIPTVDCGDDIAKWISEILKGERDGFRVGYWPEEELQRRNVIAFRPEELKVFKKLQNDYTGAYSDLSSYLLINRSSIDDLSKRVEEDVNVLRFRPNLVIEGAEAYVEDKWDWIKIGDVVFRTYRPCTRCSFTTINPETGERHYKHEPITTLKKYRTMRALGEKRVTPEYTVMGTYVGVEKTGTIKANDAVYVSKTSFF